MRYLSASDGLPLRPQRILVAGTGGAGKTHLAARIGAALQIPHVEMDALHWGAGWIKRPSFEADVAQVAQSSHWVMEWQYSVVRPLLASRADLLVWLDLSRSRVMWQVTRRTVGRVLRREVLWNGNREPPLRTILRDSDHMIRWSWRTHAATEVRVEAIGQERPDLAIVRLQSRADVERWVHETLRAAASAAT
jgi:adenylate kinase family enzyme